MVESAHSKKKFTIERSLQSALKRGDSKGAAAAGGGVYDDARAEERHEEMMQAIGLLRKDLEHLGHLEEEIAQKVSNVGSGGMDSGVMEEYKTQVAEAANLRRDLQELSDAIDETKKEIAMLANDNANDDKIFAASLELGAVVKDTEAATDSIIHAAETIEDLGNRMRADLALEEGDAATLDELSEQVINIFEACNFQDITGQRITKVVNTMNFIDERIKKMMDIWGGSDLFKDFAPEAKPETGEEMHGPALPDERISQDDIDALFD